MIPLVSEFSGDDKLIINLKQKKH